MNESSANSTFQTAHLYIASSQGSHKLCSFMTRWVLTVIIGYTQFQILPWKHKWNEVFFTDSCLLYRGTLMQVWLYILLLKLGISCCICCHLSKYTCGITLETFSVSAPVLSKWVTKSIYKVNFWGIWYVWNYLLKMH